EGNGAYIMGRKMFGGGDGQWDETWTGWWGDEPPYHTPVFVLSHHARKPLSMRGGTTFNFVTEGIESALTQARSAAGDKDVAMSTRESSVSELHVLMTGIAFGESPRWHDGRLWFCDWGAQELIAVDLEGKSEVIVRVPSFPFCIDWLRDGRLLIVSARDRR